MSALKILVADDDPINRRLLERCLVKWGYEVVLASDGAEAWNILQRDDAPRLAILDWMMPVMDGSGFLDEFAKLPDDITKNCKIIMLSTSESFKDLNKANKNRFVYKFLNKPLTDQVLAAINV